jgi:hypothetical protein
VKESIRRLREAESRYEHYRQKSENRLLLNHGNIADNGKTGMKIRIDITKPFLYHGVRGGGCSKRPNPAPLRTKSHENRVKTFYNHDQRREVK